MDDQADDLFAAHAAGDWSRIGELLAAAPGLANARDGDGNTLLHLAILGRDGEHVEQLLAAGADPNAAAASSMSPLVLAIENGCRPGLAAALAEHGADLDAIDADGFSVLERAVEGGDFGWVSALLDAGASVRPTEHGQNYPLLQAACHGMIATATTLIAAGASASDGPKKWLLPIHPACRGGHARLVELLLKNGADPDMPGREDCCLTRREGSWEQHLRNAESEPPPLLTPLALAAAGGHLAACECLLRAGADPNWGGISSAIPLVRAAHGGDAGIVALLLNHGALANLDSRDGITPLLAAVARDHLAVASILLARGAVANAADGEGWTPLHQAAVDSTPGMIGMLLARDASVFAIDHRGRTPLSVAAEVGGTGAIAELITAGSPVDLPDLDGRTPLHHAAMRGHADAVGVLLAAGAGADARDRDGATPLDLAMEQGYAEVLEMLCDSDAEDDGAR
jgi:ankyrin repeat protein